MNFLHQNSLAPEPSPSLLAQLAQEMMIHAPFAQMQAEHVQELVAVASQYYFANKEAVLSPADGVVTSLLLVRSGAITGTKGLAHAAGGAFLYEAGDMFPISAVMGARAVTAQYVASEDCFILAFPIATVQALAEKSAPLADFLHRRIQQFLDLSRQALQEELASKVLAEQSLESPLGDLIKRTPIMCRPDTPLREVLTTMHTERIGSMLITEIDGTIVGILSRYDVLDKITLPALSLDTPISAVMSQPVHTLQVDDTAHDAALIMSRLGVRHVPITKEGKAVGLLSERDLFSMQRLSLHQLSATLRDASSIDVLKKLAPDIRLFAQRLLSQGVQARQLTSLISHLNDLLTERLLTLLAVKHKLNKQQACWIALGSEGRDEQTISTDQDNAFVLTNDCDDATREKWLVLAHEANHTLDACGFPLCMGNIMASNPKLCQRLEQWLEQFDYWITHRTPEDILNACIFFDLRSLWGNHALAADLRNMVQEHAPKASLFLRLLAVNALERSVPITWTGAIDTDGEGLVDIKLRGTAIFVDSARLYALAHGLTETNTRARLMAIGKKLNIKASRYESWAAGFEFLQTLRLRVQIDDASHDSPNSVEVRQLTGIDRRMLKESFRMAQELQQRIKLEYQL